MSKSSQASPWRYRGAVAGRVLAASVGGYALTASGSSVAAQLLARVAGMAPGIAVLATTLLSFVVYTLLAMWMFRARSAWRMWRWMLVALAVLAGIDWVLRGSAWPA
ncbi:DUF3649 domain-containing protein [Xanthomonas campestris]|uniref:DUF3649 domain-containing protein n=1 Tax=Xanthomonas campestris TaxID=339 RepID=UPI001CD50BC5|nr:DUF3649 domain-containing protein [Xanthomonas campestris]